MESRSVPALATRARPLHGLADLGPLIERLATRRVVLIGEATHGTHEFYALRAALTRRLIERHGFSLVAVEADWPDAYRLNRYVRGAGEDTDADAALGAFRRFPTWMWRNVVVRAFGEWLRTWNATAKRPVGFYGLDLYSMFASMHAVIEYLDKVDPDAARRARHRYGCFGHFGEDTQAYGWAAEIGALRGCEDEAVAQLVELRDRAAELAMRDGRIPEDEHFYAEQNARLVRNAERYYRTMYRGREDSWNVRDRHMAETLDALLAYFSEHDGDAARAVVWAHNSHIGDARATEMGMGGQLNIGQLARERFGDEASLVGLTTYSGSVTAASGWDRPAELKQVRLSLPDSIEWALHELGHAACWLDLRDPATGEALEERLLERAIGVVYMPETERVSHYFHANVAHQFDALIHIDETRALTPLDAGAPWPDEDAPETFPWGLSATPSPALHADRRGAAGAGPRRGEPATRTAESDAACGQRRAP
ncbi:MAG: erythromycin esterase family protein [Longimicrobiales bacterium]